MKSSILLAVYGTIAAVSARAVDKRKYETEVSTAWTTVYVTDGQQPTPTPTPAAAVANNNHAVPNNNNQYKTSSSKYIVKTTIVAKPTTSSKAATKPTTYAPKPTKSASPAPSDYSSTAVYHHNLHRANHSAPALEWSDTHASYAAQTAKKCKFAHDLSPGGGGYGQNLAMWGSSGDSKELGNTGAVAQGITDMWYNGELDLFPTSSYGKSNPDMSAFESWGHFTQLVWAGSKQVGCHSEFCAPGTMYDDMGAWFTVCNYHPAGNMGGSYGKNVKPPKGAKAISA